jgi:hypothetical protein
VVRGQPADDTVLDVSHKRFTDADLESVAAPERIRTLVLRGHRAYGSNTVTDAGIEKVGRFQNLRVLKAAGLGLSDRALAAIGKLSDLEELNLDSNEMTGFGLSHIKGLKQLRRLSLNFNPLRPDALEPVAAMRGLTHLSVVGGLPVDDRLLELFGKLDKLHELRLPERTADVTDRGLGQLTRLPDLKNLALRDSTHITDAGLAELARLGNLQDLELRGLRSVTPRGMDVLGKLTALRRLHIDYIAMDAASIQKLASLRKLEELLIWSVSSDTLPLDALGELSALRSFRTNQPVPSSAIRALAKLKNLESITDELTEITDEDLKQLARLPKLKTLVLGSERVTAESLPTLAGMRSLRELYVTDKVHVVAEEWTRLGNESLTHCRISRFRPPYTVYHKPSE